MNLNSLRFFITMGVVVILGCGNVACARVGSDSLGSAASVPSETSQTASPSYRLGAGDKINIKVFGEDDLSGDYAVSAAGQISFPLIGNVSVENKTLDEFEIELINKLKNGYLRDPKISASVLTYRPYYILGEVGAPGEYAYSSDLSVLNAVAKAGGFTYRAKTTKIYIRRANEAEERVEVLAPELRVYPGDTIRIGERFF